MQVVLNKFDTIADRSEIQQQMVYETTQQIPGSVRYSIKRFARPENWMAGDAGVLKYHVEQEGIQNNHVELRFCIQGNMYCRLSEDECKKCKFHQATNCGEKIDSVDVLTFVFSSTILSQFVKSRLSNNTLSDDLLSFKHQASFIKDLPVCNRTRAVLEGLLNHNYSDTLENIYVNAQTQMLLLYSMDCILGEKEIDTITCRFLANEPDREKIMKARQILIDQIGEPITIKELSRKVAMNECYLKKGFKEMFGTTIFDFYQSQRMEHAKYLLYEKGLTVTEVSVMLGYSSISHFSTAFKRHTGLKPCELLFR